MYEERYGLCGICINDLVLKTQLFDKTMAWCLRLGFNGRSLASGEPGRHLAEREDEITLNIRIPMKDSVPF